MAAPKLKLFRKLNEHKLSKAAIAFLARTEGDTEYVDADRPRDAIWTDEIIVATVGYAIAKDGDEGPEILAEYKVDPQRPHAALIQAEDARKGARIMLAVDLDESPSGDEDSDRDE